jgi:iron complex outermembrane recepter protein
MKTNKKFLVASVAAICSVSSLAMADEAPTQKSPSRSQSVLMEEIVISARKRDESMQDAPLAVKAFGSDQIEALKVRDCWGDYWHCKQELNCLCF